jgi:hypothetical protein
VLDQFDFRFQPSIDKRQVRELAILTFISERMSCSRISGAPRPSIA